LHRAVNVDPELYPDPLEFKPERWIGQKPDRFGYLSFGAGKHRCPGTMFFGAEASIVFHRLFGRLDIEHFSLFEEFPKTRLAVTYFNRPEKPSTVYVRSRARVQDVPWFQPAEIVEQALDMPVDELLDGQADDEAASSLDETAEPARCPYSGAGAERAHDGADVATAPPNSDVARSMPRCPMSAPSKLNKAVILGPSAPP
jgi:hypothetical protein